MLKPATFALRALSIADADYSIFLEILKEISTTGRVPARCARTSWRDLVKPMLVKPMRGCHFQTYAVLLVALSLTLRWLQKGCCASSKRSGI